MNNIHAPTVESGPTSGRAAANGHNKDDLSLMELMDEKDRVEGEMKALSGVLDSVRATKPPVCLPSSLLTQISM